MPVDWDNAQQKAARTARWAVTMTKVRKSGCWTEIGDLGTVFR